MLFKGGVHTHEKGQRTSITGHGFLNVASRGSLSNIDAAMGLLRLVFIFVPFCLFVCFVLVPGITVSTIGLEPSITMVLSSTCR